MIPRWQPVIAGDTPPESRTAGAVRLGRWDAVGHQVRWLWYGTVLACGLFPAALSAVTLKELNSDPKLNPKRFASHFDDFEFELNLKIQPPNVFLARKRGDCDDYAVLADQVLGPKGFATRLIQVKLAGQIDHAVCYVSEAKAYLDYNNRAVFFTLTRSDESVREIAGKVAASLEVNWTSAFEFKYTDRKKVIIATVVKTAPPESDPVPGQGTENAVKVNF
jgi:hypothetical protein